MNLSKLMQKAICAESVDKKELADLISNGIAEGESEKIIFKKLYEHIYGDTLCRELCEKWVDNMHHEGDSGEKFTVSQAEECAKRLEIDFENEDFTKYEMWAVMNCMYYDFRNSLKKSGVTPDENVCARMAFDFMDDEDAMPGKPKNYYFHVVTDCDF